MPSPDKFSEVKRVGRGGIHFCLARVPSTNRCFFGSDDTNVYEVDLTVEKPEPLLLGVPRETDENGKVTAAKPDGDDANANPVGHTSWVTGIAVAGERVISGSWDRSLIWWNGETGEKVKTIDRAHERWIRKVVASPDGKLVATVADDMVCRLWDAASGKLVREMKGHEEITPHHYHSMLYTATFSPDGQHLATADKTGQVVVWKVASGEQVATFESPENYTWDPRARRHSIGGIRSLAFSPDGNTLAVGGIGQIGNVDHLGSHALLQTYDWRKGERVHRFAHSKHKGLVEQIAWDPDSKWLFAAGGANGGFTFFADLAGEKQGPRTEEDPKKFSKQPSGKFLRDDDAKFHVHAFAVDDAFEHVFACGHGNLAHWKLA